MASHLNRCPLPGTAPVSGRHKPDCRQERCCSSRRDQDRVDRVGPFLDEDLLKTSEKSKTLHRRKIPGVV